MQYLKLLGIWWIVGSVNKLPILLINVRFPLSNRINKLITPFMSMPIEVNMVHKLYHTKAGRLQLFSKLCKSEFNSIALPHWGRDKMAAIFQTTFPNAFSWRKMHEFQLQLRSSLCLRVQLTIFQCYTGIYGLNFPELPSRGILGKLFYFIVRVNCVEYEWMGSLNERMSICGMNGKFYAYFCNKKFSVNNFGAKIEASGDPGWCRMGIQNHAVEVNTRVHQQRSGVVVGSHGKKTLFLG